MEEKNLDKKWFNYFSNMRNKYNMRVSANKILIIFLDAKDSTLNNRFLLKDRKTGFFDSMGLTARYFTNKYNCLSLWGTDEISFIIEDTDFFISSINNEKNFRTHDIVSIFSQYFFKYFNSVYNGETVYWHCKCFNISKEKLQSYIKFKSKGILKGVTSIFLKQNGIKNLSNCIISLEANNADVEEAKKEIEARCLRINCICTHIRLIYLRCMAKKWL